MFDVDGEGAFQTHTDNTSRPLSDRGAIAKASLSGPPVTMKFYVRILAPRVALACPHKPLSATPAGPEYGATVVSLPSSGFHLHMGIVQVTVQYITREQTIDPYASYLA